jgi:hypothetical protein
MTTEAGPISSALEEDVMREVPRHGIVVWLDKDNSYGSFVDGLIARHKAGDLREPVVAYRGSFLETMLALEPYGMGVDNEPLLVHVPGLTKLTIRETPLLALYEASQCYLKSLDTLVREVAHGKVQPDDLDGYITSSPTMTLAEADAWLANRMTGARGEFGRQLDLLGIEDVAMKVLTGETAFLGRVQAAPEREALRAFLERHTGMDRAWRDFCEPFLAGKEEEKLADQFAAWVLSVKYVMDLARAPHLERLKAIRSLARPAVSTCTGIVAKLRQVSPERYANLADEVEALVLHEELSAIAPEDLGQIDTFRIEESRILAAAMEALQAGKWQAAGEFARVRTQAASFWLEQDRSGSRKVLWGLVADAAGLGQALDRYAEPLAGVTRLDEAIAWYTGGAYAVDLAHRQFEQVRADRLKPDLPCFFAEFQEIVSALRVKYRGWADGVARAFSRLCRDNGFLPTAELQQRTTYDQAVHALAAGPEAVAVIMVDALRFEMAVELAAELKRAGAEVDLSGRLAELPTITSVGMNALAPVVRDGRLVLAKEGALKGFRTGEYVVDGPDDRARAVGGRSIGETARRFELPTVCNETVASLKKSIGGKKLIIVCSREIDDAGEANMGPGAFNRILGQIKAAWHNLQAAGIQQFVIVSDHGFLLQDETTVEIPYGSRRDPCRRYVLADEPRAESGMVPVSLASLGYDDSSGEAAKGHLLFREDTAIFATGTQGATFVHGGNSLQERVVPVLRVGRRRELVDFTAYAIEAAAMPDVPGMSRVQVRVMASSKRQSILPLGPLAPLVLTIVVPGDSGLRAVIKGANQASVKGDRLEVPVGDSWAEVFFSVEGPHDGRVGVALVAPDAGSTIPPCKVEGLFAVTYSATGTTSAPITSLAATTDWKSAIPDEGGRKVFAHIEKHGSVSETELSQILGGSRAVRKFSVKFDEFLRMVPFRVRIDTGAGEKRYVKEGDA